ncbi:MAG: hypothetical protein K0R90_706 [Oscillospiraceae bacterium]|nr:hypothetical protein [Oscillospiraceae bacterium]
MDNEHAAQLLGTKNGKKTTPLVSIVVLAYNNLDYTSQCIESIYRYTSHIDFELITVNNGSTDGTAEYLNSLSHSKKISFPKNIGVCKAINHGFRIAEGKYTMNVSNDIVVTKNWLDNLLIAMETDPKIGMIVPICNASCNYQQINPPGKSMEEIQAFAEKYNVSNPNRWEERLKLSTYAGIYRTKIQKALGGFDEDFNPGCYDDDAICFSIRRMGYKVILAKDTFVHHYGACSFNEEYDKDTTLQVRNKNLFMLKFGVDPYVAGLIDYDVLDLFTYNSGNDVNILGIGNSYGTTALQLKNICKQYGNNNVSLYYLSGQKNNMIELKTICDGCIYSSLSEVNGLFGNRKYEYIIIENPSEGIENKKELYTTLYNLLKQGGQIVCTAANDNILYETMGIFSILGARFNKHKNYYYLCFSRT